MSASRMPLLLVAFLVVLLPVVARANVDRTFCAAYSVAYTDGSVGDHLLGSSVYARGVTIRIHNLSTGVHTDYTADVGGASPGCVTASLDNSPGVTYKVNLLSIAAVEGNTAKVTDEITHNVYSTTLAASYDPASGSPGTYFVGPGPIIHIMAAATWGLFNGTGSVSGETFEFHANASRNYYNWPSTEIEIRDDDYKFAILHELGHAIFDAANGFSGTSRSYNADVDACSTMAYSNGSHWANSKEFQSAAAWEGVADFYAAHALNNHSTYDADCDFYQWYEVDWDLDGDDTNDPDDPNQYSCEDGIASLSIPSLDYLGEYCIASGDHDNRATQYDWLRTWWDLRTDQSLTLSDIEDLWVLAGPEDWTASGTGTGVDYPAERFHEGAFDFGGSGFQVDLDGWAADQGVHR